MQITVQVSDRQVREALSRLRDAGTNVVYATTQQFGAARGEFGATRRGRPIPFGDIRARAFVGFSSFFSS